jgi:hypothetical protein
VGLISSGGSPVIQAINSISINRIPESGAVMIFSAKCLSESYSTMSNGNMKCELNRKIKSLDC